MCSERWMQAFIAALHRWWAACGVWEVMEVMEVRKVMEVVRGRGRR